MDIFLSQLTAWLHTSKYFLAFFGAFTEGPLVMIAGGFLYRLGQFEFWPLYAALVGGDLAADIFWYTVGYHGAKRLIYRWGKFLGITPEIIDKLGHKFREHQTKILIFSKLTMGFGFALATLTTAGMVKVPFRRYTMINLIGGLIWVLFLIGVGYFFGNVYETIAQPFKIAFVVVIVLAIGIALRSLAIYLKKQEL